MATRETVPNRHRRGKDPRPSIHNRRSGYRPDERTSYPVSPKVVPLDDDPARVIPSMEMPPPVTKIWSELIVVETQPAVNEVPLPKATNEVTINSTEVISEMEPNVHEQVKDKHLHEIAFVINTAPHQSTSCSPALDRIVMHYNIIIMQSSKTIFSLRKEKIPDMLPVGGEVYIWVIMKDCNTLAAQKSIKILSSSLDTSRAVLELHELSSILPIT
ncbi:hypothetical protein FQA39_LY08931 [Lamprigera yunnana]|nr:hypothetical protein FQA39_LY08931 [Lamprigera yunnana]